jgi:hypothetical protein
MSPCFAFSNGEIEYNNDYIPQTLKIAPAGRFGQSYDESVTGGAPERALARRPSNVRCEAIASGAINPMLGMRILAVKTLPCRVKETHDLMGAP